MRLELTEHGRKVSPKEWFRHHGMYKSPNDELVAIMTEVLRELAPLHGISRAEFSSTADDIHAVLTIHGKPFYMVVPASGIDKARKTGAREMTKDRKADIAKRFKRLFLDAMGRR